MNIIHKIIIAFENKPCTFVPLATASRVWNNPGGRHVGLRGPGSSFDFNAIGDLDLGGQVVLSTSYTYDALDRLFITPDFSKLGATSHSVEILLNDVVIASVGGLTGPVTETDSNPECIIWDIKDSCSHGGAQWPGPLPLTIPGSGTFLGDSLLTSAHDGMTSGSSMSTSQVSRV